MVGDHISLKNYDPLMGVGLDSLQTSQLIDDIGAYKTHLYA